MRVQLMLTCLCDALYGEVGIAAVRVLEHAGVEVDFPEEQTCCGQPPFNAGDWQAARPIAQHCATTFGTDSIVVTPSGSCAAMIRHGYPLLKQADAPRCYELTEFLIDYLELDRWPLRGSRSSRSQKVALHKACHGRILGMDDKQERLLRLIPGLEVVPFAQAEQCCGFGGAFSATHGKVSSDIGIEKLRHIHASGATTIVSGDMGCLVHLEGLVKRHELDLHVKHLAQVLAEVLDS